MRSAEQAQVSTIRHSDSRLLLMRVVMAVVSTLALLFVWHPVVVAAQEAPPSASAPDAQPPKTAAKPAPASDTASTSHVVKAGETLWSIASRYYGDGHQWRAVARRNGIQLSADTALRIGTKLVIPSKKTVVAAASVASTLPARSDTTTPKSVTTPAGPPAPAPVTTPELKAKPATTGTLAAQTGNKPPAPAAQTAKPAGNEEKLFERQQSRISVVSNSDMRAARGRSEATTVFLLHTASADDAAAARAASNSRQPEPRTAEFLAAPFVIPESQWVSMGRVMKRIDGATAENPQPGRMHLADRVDITPPPGVKVSVGDRFMAVRPGGLINEHISVVIPTGILEVTNVGNGTLVRAHVRSLSGPLEEGQAVVAITASPAPVGVAPAASSADLETIVTWTEKGELLPTVESYVVIAAGEGERVKAGDLFEFVRPTAQGTEERLAIGRVLRSGPHGSSLILFKQWRSGMQPGVKARRYAKMP